MRHLPELDDIQAFVAVAEERSFRRAARRLHLDQSAVSRRVQALERRVGTPLLLRTTRTVALTPAGEAFFAENRDLLRMLDRAVQAARRAAEGERGRLSIGYMSFAATGAMPRAVRAFRARHPEVGVALTYMDTQAQQSALARGVLDLGFLIGPVAAEGFSTLPVAEEPLVALLPARHRLARRREAPGLRELAAAGLILGDAAEWDSFRALLAGAFAGRGLALAPVLEPTTAPGIFGLVAAGLGVSLYPRGAPMLGLAGIVTRPITDPPPPIRTMLAWHGTPGPAAQRFIAACAGTRD
jgi:DNA-binding transcriptional LysR family regulator